MHDRRLATVFTQKLLAPSTVFAVPDNIATLTFRTIKDYCFYNHMPFIPSFRKSHYRKIFFPVPSRIGSELVNEQRNILNIWLRFNSNIGALYSFSEKVTELADESDREKIKAISAKLAGLFRDNPGEVEKEIASLFPSIDDLDIYPDIRNNESVKELLEELKDTSFIEQVKGWEKKHPFKSQKFAEILFSAFIDPPMNGVILRKSILISLVTFLEILIQDVFVSHFLAQGEIKKKALELADGMSNSWGKRLSNLEIIGIGTLAQSKYREEIIEITKRRNLLVHNDGVVDDDYLGKAPQKFKSIKPGSVFIVSTQYLQRALDITYAFGLYLCIKQWKLNHIPEIEQSKEIDKLLIPALNKRRYKLVLEITNHLSDECLPIQMPQRFLADRAIAYRELGQAKEVKKIITKLEKLNDHWSNSVAIAMLTNNLADLQKVLKDNRIPANISSWPLFDPVKDEIWFKNIFMQKNKHAVRIQKNRR